MATAIITGEMLKPCPFCGGEARAFFCEESGTYDVQCQQCGALPFLGKRRGSGRFKSMDDVIAAWNRRAGRTCQIVVSIDRSPASYGGRVHRCSSCGKALPKALFRNGWTQLDYCPRCGARVTEVVRDGD